MWWQERKLRRGCQARAWCLRAKKEGHKRQRRADEALELWRSPVERGCAGSDPAKFSASNSCLRPPVSLWGYHLILSSLTACNIVEEP